MLFLFWREKTDERKKQPIKVEDSVLEPIHNNYR
jgi:hypothetical protein